MEQYTGLYTGEGDEGMKEVREREEKGGRGEGRGKEERKGEEEWGGKEEDVILFTSEHQVLLVLVQMILFVP